MDKEIMERYAEEMRRMRARAVPAATTTKPEQNPEPQPTPKPEPAFPDNGDMAVGRLLVNVTTLRELYPVPDAAVTVYLTENGTRQKMADGTTDRSGRSPVFALPTPKKSLSESAGAAERPYAVYDIEIGADGYVGQLRRNVPVFPGVLSVQSADLLLLSAADGHTDTQVFDESETYEL